MPTSVNIVSPYKESIYRYLDSNGDGTGSNNANLDFGSSPDVFYIQPAENQIFYLNRMIVSVGDGAGMQAEEYGNLGSALTNGITVCVVDDGGIALQLCGGIPVKTNAGWGRICFDVELKTWGAGDELLVVRWTFAKAGYPIRLIGSKNERLEVSFSDNMTGLLSHYYLVEGWVD